MKNMGPTALCVGYRLRYLGENPANIIASILNRVAITQIYMYTFIRRYIQTDVVVDASAQYCKTFPPHGYRTATLFYIRPNIRTYRSHMNASSRFHPRYDLSVLDTLLSTLVETLSSFQFLHFSAFSARSLNFRLAWRG